MARELAGWPLTFASALAGRAKPTAVRTTTTRARIECIAAIFFSQRRRSSRVGGFYPEFAGSLEIARLGAPVDLFARAGGESIERHGAEVALPVAAKGDLPALGLLVPDDQHVRRLAQLA